MNAEDIVRRLAAIPIEDITEGGVVGGREWRRCKICRAADMHADDCPWFMARLWRQAGKTFRPGGIIPKPGSVQVDARDFPLIRPPDR